MTKFYSPSMVRARGIYSVNNLIMSGGVVQHEWHSETLQGELYRGDDISNQQSDEFRDKFVMLCLEI